MSSDTLRGEYVVNERDLLVALREANQDTTGRSWLTVAIGGVILLFAAYAWISANRFDAAFYGAMAVIVLGTGLLDRPRIEWWLRARVNESPQLGRRVEVAATPTHLVLAIPPDLRTEMRLDALYGAEAREGGLLVAMMSGAYTWIPDRAFSATGVRDHFHRRVLNSAGLVPVAVS